MFEDLNLITLEGSSSDPYILFKEKMRSKYFPTLR